MEKYLMGIDAGNTSSKVVIFDLYGKMIATAATPSMHFKRRGEGFEEFDVTELWNLISVCIKEAVEKAAVAPEQIASVGVTSFGNGDNIIFKLKDSTNLIINLPVIFLIPAKNRAWFSRK